ncbi:hypothetical protein V6Z11_D06G115800 [Gossypium hirsutum]
MGCRYQNYHQVIFRLRTERQAEARIGSWLIKYGDLH